MVTLPLFAVVAILGFLIGHRHPAPPPEEPTHSAWMGSVLLTYPMSWRRTTASPEIARLGIEHPLVLAPSGASATAGLLTGTLRRDPHPLPAEFLSHLRGFPRTTVVSLPETQAYRYSGLSIGSGQLLTLYMIPKPGADPTAVACYAERSLAAYLRACEHIVASLSVAGLPQSLENILTPDPGYAHQVGESLTSVGAGRAALRREAGRPVSPRNAGRIATRQAAALAAAANRLAGLRPPPAAAQAQTSLLASLTQARLAYLALAVAAKDDSPALYSEAQGGVARAEQQVTIALRDFALIGYDAS